MLVALDLARKHVRADEDEDGELLGQYLTGAQQVAIDYLNRPVFATQEDLDAAIAAGNVGESAIVVNAAIRAAILMTFGDMYKQRESLVTGVSVHELPMVQDLLRPHRLVNGV